MAKKAVVFLGSPRKGGNSDALAESYVRGLRENGWECEIARCRTIAPCLACDACRKNGGVCVQRDAMQELCKKAAEAQLLVFASPIYWFNISAQLKTAIDRLYCLGGEEKRLTQKSYAALLAAADTDQAVFAPAIASFKAIAAFCGWREDAIITASSVQDKGTVTAGLLQKAYEAGLAAI